MPYFVTEKIINEVDVMRSVIDHYCDSNTQFMLSHFMNQVKSFFESKPALHGYPLPVVHSVKSRLKDKNHLLGKLKRKLEKGVIISCENLFDIITDLAGVRVLHLYHGQFPTIHSEIMNQIESKDWTLREEPKAYTWDPETKDFFNELGISTEVKDTYYTSVHYVVQPNNTSGICCEVQVRTLFEEIWGEIDHSINYPHKTSSVACSEQLRVLSKLVSTGTRLSDSIFKSFDEHANPVRSE